MVRAYRVLLAAFSVGVLSRAIIAADAPSAGTPAVAHEGQSGQTPQSFEMKKQLNFLLYLPPEYKKEETKNWPLVLFLHGSGERGTNLDDVKKHGPPKLVAEGKAFPFILVSPQCPPGQWWDAYVLKGLLDDVQAKYHVDPDRVYVTGLSMGGFATWDLARLYPKHFAAIVPICGGGDPQFASSFAHVPVWAFHGEVDPTVPIHRTEEMVDALKKAGDPEVKFTRYPNVGHDSWVKAYEDPELYEWMLSHKRQPTTRSQDR